MEEDDYTFDFEEFPEAKPVKKVVLYIMDCAGHTEDILVDIDDIYNYVKTIYADYPEGA
jgi:hypothetical protein